MTRGRAAPAGGSQGPPGRPGTDPDPLASLLPRVAADSPAAILLVEVASLSVLYANDLARALAPGLGLPCSVDSWSRRAGLLDVLGRHLADGERPLSRLARGELVDGTPVTALRASASTTEREPLVAMGLPLHGAPDLSDLALVVLLPVRSAAAVRSVREEAERDVLLRERAVLATGISFTVADATRPDVPLVWVNPAFSLCTGYSAQEVIGRNCRFLQGPDTDRAAVAELRRAVQEGRDLTTTLLNYRKDGTAFWNELAINPVRDGEGRLTHFVGVQTDVTLRVEAEHERRLALEAEQVAKAEAQRALAEAEQVRAELEAGSRRLALVAEATGMLAATLDVAESIDRLADLLVPLLADWVAVVLADDAGELGAPAVVKHRDGHEADLERYSRLVPARLRPGPLHDVVTDGRPRLLSDFRAPDAAGLTDAEAEVREISERLGARSLMLVPLVARRRVLGTMMLVRGPDSPVFTMADLDLAGDLGRRAGLTVDNARLYQREHRTALTLQRSLLPELVQIPGLALAADYLPSTHGAQIGGDWWDVFPLPDGATGLAIGDVMGHDVAAAAAMGQLRSVLRTCAWAGDEPATVLDRMDQLVQNFDMAQMATCVYARLEPPDPAAGDGERHARLLWTNAGHLPPVVVSGRGEVSLLGGDVSVPLGVPTGDRRGSGDVSFAAGTTLLLYTDGLVETRDSDIDTDLADLVRRVERHIARSSDPADLVRGLTGDLSRLDDDVAVLAVTVL